MEHKFEILLGHCISGSYSRYISIACTGGIVDISIACTPFMIYGTVHNMH